MSRTGFDGDVSVGSRALDGERSSCFRFGVPVEVVLLVLDLVVVALRLLLLEPVLRGRRGRRRLARLGLTRLRHPEQKILAQGTRGFPAE